MILFPSKDIMLGTKRRLGLLVDFTPGTLIRGVGVAVRGRSVLAAGGFGTTL